MADDQLTTDPPTKANMKRKCPWLRRVGVVVGCLLAGAIINVLVAWGCVYFQDYATRVSERIANDAEIGLVASWNPAVNVGDPVWVRVLRSPGCVSRSFTRGTKTPSEALFVDDSESVFIDQRGGWPALSLWCGWQNDFDYDNPAHHNWWGLDLAASEGAHDNLWFPLRPILAGLLINTIFYSSLVWALCAATRVVRRHRRAKSKQCPNCGYDLRGADHGKCPECGEAVSEPLMQ